MAGRGKLSSFQTQAFRVVSRLIRTLTSLPYGVKYGSTSSCMSLDTRICMNEGWLLPYLIVCRDNLRCFAHSHRRRFLRIKTPFHNRGHRQRQQQRRQREHAPKTSANNRTREKQEANYQYYYVRPNFSSAVGLSRPENKKQKKSVTQRDPPTMASGVFQASPPSALSVDRPCT